jgi:alpha-N-acetylglucosamine transferase
MDFVSSLLLFRYFMTHLTLLTNILVSEVLVTKLQYYINVTRYVPLSAEKTQQQREYLEPTGLSSVFPSGMAFFKL